MKKKTNVKQHTRKTKKGKVAVRQHPRKIKNRSALYPVVNKGDILIGYYDSKKQVMDGLQNPIKVTPLEMQRLGGRKPDQHLIDERNAYLTELDLKDMRGKMREVKEFIPKKYWRKEDFEK